MNSEHMNLSSPELIKNKYYKAEEVNVLLKNCTDILKRLQMENQNQKKEIASLKEQCTELTNQKTEVSDAIVSSKIVARQIIAEAKKEAGRMLTEAETEAQRIKEKAGQEAEALIAQAKIEEEVRIKDLQEEKTQKTIENLLSKTAERFARLKEEQLRITDQIDEEWQELLIQVYGNENTEEGQREPEPSASVPKTESEIESEPEPENTDEMPDDISEKVEAIARQLKIFTDDE